MKDKEARKEIVRVRQKVYGLEERLSALAEALGYTFEEVEAQPSKIVAKKKGK